MISSAATRPQAPRSRPSRGEGEDGRGHGPAERAELADGLEIVAQVVHDHGGQGLRSGRAGGLRVSSAPASAGTAGLSAVRRSWARRRSERLEGRLIKRTDNPTRTTKRAKRMAAARVFSHGSAAGGQGESFSPGSPWSSVLPGRAHVGRNALAPDLLARAVTEDARREKEGVSRLEREQLLLGRESRRCDPDHLGLSAGPGGRRPRSRPDPWSPD